MRVTYYDDFSRLTKLKPQYAWALRVMVVGSLVALVVMAI